MEKPELSTEVPWAPETIEWFEHWRSSPRTDNWDALQWQYLMDTAVVHSCVWGSQDYSMLGELRTRESYMGLTFEPQKTQAAKATVTPLDIVRGKYRGANGKKAGRAKAANQN